MEFNILKAEEFCDSVKDGTHDSPKKANKGYKLITSKHIREYNLDLDNSYYISKEDYNKINQRSQVEKNDILYSMIGTIGLIYRVKENPEYAIKNIGLFKIKDELKSKWLYYYLKTPKMKKYIKTLLSGSTQQYITLKNLRELPIEVPTNNENMKQIVKILENIDKKIELNNQINNNLFNLIKNMYFKMQEDMTEFKNIKLKDIANISSGKRPKNKGVEYNIPLIGASGIMSYTEEYNSDNDILVIGRVGTLGVVQRYFEKIWLSDNTLTIKTVYSNVLENYLKYVDYQSLNRGSTQPLITQTDISNLDIKFNEKEFNKFEDEVIKLRKKIELNNKQNKILEQLRDTLLPKLMNGEIDLIKIEV